MTFQVLNRLLFFVLICLSIAQLQGQTPGKIAGVVRDAQSGEALIGVNVQVEETLLGASTDGDGYFVILNVPPGTYRLNFQYIGYQTTTVNEVQVKIDRTSTVELRMQSSSITVDEVVEVVASRDIVEVDKTFSSTHYDGEVVEDLPVEGLRNVLELSPSINRNPNGSLSIRGGNAYEINFSVNGIKSLNTNTGIPAYGTGDKSENTWKLDVNPLAVSQLEVVTGGFNAEYGNAQSGVVKVVMREGGQRFNGAFQVEYRPPGQYHWGDYLYSRDQFEWQRWGDLSAWYPEFRDITSGVIDSARARKNYELWVKNHTPSEDNVLGVYDYRDQPYTRYLFSFGGPLGRNPDKLNFFFSGELKNKPTRLPTVEQVQELNNFSAVVAFRPSPTHEFKFTSLYQFYLSGQGFRI